MRIKPALPTLAVLLFAILALSHPQTAQAAGATTEYAMIRFDGLDHSQVVWPDGRVEFMDTLVPGAKAHIESLDERIYVLTLLMNLLSKQGYDYIEMISTDQVLMKRAR